MSEQTATDRLRELLDERGVEWFAIAETATEYTQEGIVYRAYEFCDGLQVVIVTPVAPEQAVSATVGVGTCRFEIDLGASDRCQGPVYSCSRCGTLSYTNETSGGTFKYCPNCGRRIEVRE